MEPASPGMPPLWLWRGVVGTLTMTLATGALLSLSLAAGWNDPQPQTPADWRASAPFTIETADAAARQMMPLGVSANDFVMEAVVTPLDGSDFNAYGLSFAQNTSRYAVFAMGSDGYLAVLWIDGDVETALLDWQAFPHIRRGDQSNHLRVSCGGGACRFWVNDEYVTALPNDVAGGGLGLWVRRFEPGPLRVRFDRVAVWQGARAAPCVSSCPKLCFEYNPVRHIRWRTTTFERRV